MVENKPYEISRYYRIDSRFYMVEIAKRFYLIDYSNPKDFRNYLVPFFPDTISSWIAYDVTQDKELFKESKIWKLFESFKKVLFCFFVFFIINSILLPEKFRLSYWTTDKELTKNWISILLCIFMGIFVIIFILISLMNKVENLEKYPTLILQETDKTVKRKMNIIVKGIISSLIVYPILLFIGIGGNNYIQLLLFGFIGTYCFVFIKFVEFHPANTKIHLKKNVVDDRIINNNNKGWM